MTAKGSDKSKGKKLDLGKETIKDLDVPEKKAKDVKGGGGGQHTITCPVYLQAPPSPSSNCTA